MKIPWTGSSQFMLFTWYYYSNSQGQQLWPNFCTILILECAEFLGFKDVTQCFGLRHYFNTFVEKYMLNIKNVT